jgi:hypothetical protein
MSWGEFVSTRAKTLAIIALSGCDIAKIRKPTPSQSNARPSADRLIKAE